MATSPSSRQRLVCSVCRREGGPQDVGEFIGRAGVVHTFCRGRAQCETVAKHRAVHGRDVREKAVE